MTLRCRKPIKKMPIIISITRDGRDFLSAWKYPVQPGDLPAKVKDLQTNRSDKTVYITADARARFASVTDVIDNLRTARVDQLGLITEAIQGQKQKKYRSLKRPIERE